VSLVSYHLGGLKAAGLVSARRSSADGRDTYYRVDLDRFARVLASAGRALHPGLGLTAEVGRRPPATGQPRVLFLCTGNSARSQMAEALVEERSGRAVSARSAGSHPKPLHPNAVRVMAERGIDIAGRPTKHLSRFAGDRFDRVITLCDKVREVCPEFPGHPPTSHWSMPDPAATGTGTGTGTDETSYQAFVQVAEELDHRIGFLLAELGSPETDPAVPAPGRRTGAP
jgi:protein-tyrosine-phosphatase